MTLSEGALEQFMSHYADATQKEEGGLCYVHLPHLVLPNGTEVEALIRVGSNDSYPTRLFLPDRVEGKGANWTPHCILGKTWWTWSWNNVPADLPLIEILLDHLGALR